MAKLNQYQSYLQSIIEVDNSKEIFEAEKKDRIIRIGRKKALTEWLQGLCEAVPIEFEYYVIFSLYEKWLGRKLTEAEEKYVAENWFSSMAENLEKLWRLQKNE